MLSIHGAKCWTINYGYLIIVLQHKNKVVRVYVSLVYLELVTVRSVCGAPSELSYDRYQIQYAHAKNEKDNSTVRLIQVNNYQLYNCKTFMHTDRQSRITRRQQTLLLKVLCGFQITWNSFEMLCLILTFKH